MTVPLIVTRADLSAARPPRWAWEKRLVLGYLNLLIGNEGIGKGVVLAWIIASLTNGALSGDLNGHPINVAVIGDEDSFADVWTPRLHAAGTDLSRVFQIERPDGGYVDLAKDRDALKTLVTEREISAVLLDQLLDNLGVGVDDWRQKAVRDALQPARSLAREMDLLLLGTLHPNKRADSFRQLVSGAAAFNAVSRSSLLLAEHPEDDRRRVLARGKGNLSREPESVEFTVSSFTFQANGFDFNVPRATNFTAGTLTVDDLIGSDGVREEHTQIAEACEVIEALLPHDGNWHPAKALKDACAADGIDERTAKRAKERLGIEHRRTSTFPAATEWRWGASQDTARSSVLTVPTVPTVPTANESDPSIRSSWDTQDTQDTQDAMPERDLTAFPDESFEDWDQRTDEMSDRDGERS